MCKLSRLGFGASRFPMELMFCAHTPLIVSARQTQSHFGKLLHQGHLCIFTGLKLVQYRNRENSHSCVFHLRKAHHDNHYKGSNAFIEEECAIDNDHHINIRYDCTKINSIDAEKIKLFYRDYFIKCGTTCGWVDFETAEMVYECSSRSSLQKWTDFTSVLDVGSGEAHFFRYLRKHRNFKGTYVGVELIPELHERAILLCGQEPNCELHFGEFTRLNLGKSSFDWVFANGTLSVSQSIQEQADRAFIRHMVFHARKGITISVLSDRHFDPSVHTLEPQVNARDVMFHNVPKLVKMIRKLFPVQKIQVDECFGASVMIHVLLNEPLDPSGGGIKRQKDMDGI